MSSQNFWRSCSSCKSEIAFGSLYYICSVSTCRQKKTDYVFCGIECWDQHVPIERHRDDVSAIEKRAPHTAGAEPRRVVITQKSSSASTEARSTASTSVDGEILVVASKVKKYISERSRMNTSASAMEALTDHVKRLCEVAIQTAREDGRKTVMDRDFPNS